MRYNIFFLNRLHATLLAVHSIRGAIVDPPADVTPPSGRADRHVRDVHGPRVRICYTL